MLHFKTLRNGQLFLDVWVLQWCSIAITLRSSDHLWELKCGEQKKPGIQVNPPPVSMLNRQINFA